LIQLIQYGRSIRWFNDYLSEVAFSKKNGFDFMQLWYMKGKLILDQVPEPKEQSIKQTDYPVIIHAVYDLDDFNLYTTELIRILKYLEHKEVIIHPVCESQPITQETIYALADNIFNTNQLLKQEGIKLYIENNSSIDIINYKPEDIKIIFDRNPDVELLLDIAHIDNIEHLKEIIQIKYPTCLHIADKHNDKKHEHLPLGQGELDYELIFKQDFKDFEGKIIFEIVGTDEEIISSLQRMKKINQD
jgi:sugar phosphate isomerase/epimerase